MSDIIIPHFGGGYNDHRRKGMIIIIQKNLTINQIFTMPRISLWQELDKRWPKKLAHKVRNDLILNNIEFIFKKHFH
jgi:hypothetical protein